MSDRALVMREGRLVGEFTRAEASEEKLLASAAGVSAMTGHPHERNPVHSQSPRRWHYVRLLLW